MTDYTDGKTYDMLEPELAERLRAKGFQGKELATALKVAEYESRRFLSGLASVNTDADKKDFSLGLFQINFLGVLAGRAVELDWTDSGKERDQQIAALAKFNLKLRQPDTGQKLVEKNITTIEIGDEGYLDPEQIWENNWKAFDLVYKQAKNSARGPWSPWSVHPSSEQFEHVNKGNFAEAQAEFNNDVTELESRLDTILPGNPAFDGMTGMNPDQSLNEQPVEKVDMEDNPAFDGMLPNLSWNDTDSGVTTSRNFDFLKNRDDAWIIVNGEKVNVADHISDWIENNTLEDDNGNLQRPTSEQIFEQFDRWLPTTEWYQNTSPTKRARQAEWGSQGLNQSLETITPARLGLIEEKFQIVSDLLGAEGITQSEAIEGESTAAQQVAILAYYNDWNENEITKYISGVSVDGEQGVDLITAGASQPGSQIRQIKTQIRQTASNYLQSLSQEEENTLAKRIYIGELNPNNLRTIFEEKARISYQHLADYFDAGGNTVDFLGNYNSLVKDLLGRDAEWSGRDSTLANSILTGARNTQGYVGPMSNASNEDAPGSFVSDTMVKPGDEFEQVDRVLTVSEAQRAIMRGREYDGSSAGLKNMSSILNTAGKGMGFF